MKKMIQEVYETAVKELGQEEAKKFLSSMVFNVVSDCQDAGNPNIGEAIEKEVIETHRIFVLKKSAA